MEIKECDRYLKQEDVSILKDIATEIQGREEEWTDQKITNVTHLLDPFIKKIANHVESAFELIKRDVTVTNINNANALLIHCKEAYCCLANIAVKARDAIRNSTVNCEQLNKFISELLDIGETFNVTVDELHRASDLLKECQMTEQQKCDEHTEIKVDATQDDSKAQPVRNIKDIKRLFNTRRRLVDVSGTDNNCFFNAVNEQRGVRKESDYSVDTLRQKARIGVREKGNTWQAYIDAAPAVATHLHRPIVMLIDSYDYYDKGTSVYLSCPANEESKNGYGVPIRVESLTKSETIYDAIVDYSYEYDESRYDDIINVVAEVLNVEREALKKLTVLDALGKLLNDENVIALYFNGNTKSGHFQSYVMEGQTEPKSKSLFDRFMKK